ncbi:MAG: SDR family oxidoreductase [Candidatus Aminicenantaceae bacterium]
MKAQSAEAKNAKGRSFTGKVIWITGASSGIGEALSYVFSGLGARLILSSRNAVALERVKRNCPGEKRDIHVLPLDLSRLGSLNEKAGHAENIYGKIDVLVHNAGVASRGLVVDTDIDVDKHIMDINYFGPVLLTKALLPSMLKRKSGQFLVVSSISGKFGVPKLSSYSASKHALHGFFESLRAEVFKNNIQVTMAVPGFVKTGITVKALRGNGSRYGRVMQVQEEGISPENCARSIVSALLERKEEALIGRTEILSVLCKRLFPRLFSNIIRNHPVRKLRSLKRLLSSA